VTHNGCKEPYQLHCSPEIIGVLLLEREVLVATETLEGADELVTGGVPEQMLPVKVGTSAEPPRLSTWKPKVALWPGCKLPFQLKFEAVYGLLPLTFAFHEPVRRLVLYCQPILHPFTAEVPLLVTIISPVRPVFHSLLIL
jgi:hypothetical protein